MRELNRKDLRLSYATALICIAGLAGLIVGLTVKSFKAASKEAKVEEKVSAYEKTLPGYLEQKQKVEHFRDSLINAQKGK